jgi:hypothetical protein
MDADGLRRLRKTDRGGPPAAAFVSGLMDSASLVQRASMTTGAAG